MKGVVKMWGYNAFPYVSSVELFFTGGGFARLLWGLIALMIAYLVLRFMKTRRSRPRRGDGAAIDILKTRLARGEIDENEYFRLKNALLRF